MTMQTMVPYSLGTLVSLSRHLASVTETFGGSNTIMFSCRGDFGLFSGIRKQWEAFLDSTAFDEAGYEGVSISEASFLIGGRNLPTALAKAVPESELSTKEQAETCSTCADNICTDGICTSPISRLPTEKRRPCSRAFYTRRVYFKPC
jgi:hypothetical protein